jgi:hypothetical protein
MREQELVKKNLIEFLQRNGIDVRWGAPHVSGALAQLGWKSDEIEGALMLLFNGMSNPQVHENRSYQSSATQIQSKELSHLLEVGVVVHSDRVIEKKRKNEHSRQYLEEILLWVVILLVSTAFAVGVFWFMEQQGNVTYYVPQGVVLGALL